MRKIFTLSIFLLLATCPTALANDSYVVYGKNNNVRTLSKHDAKLLSTQGVVVQKDHLRHLYDYPTLDPGWEWEWLDHLNQIAAPAGWAKAGEGEGITIAILDTGITLNHPEFQGKLVPGYDYVQKDTIPQDPHGHGTLTASMAAGLANNNIGLAGVAPKANIMPLRVMNSQGEGQDSDIAKAIIWATNHGANVINMSLGGPDPSPVLQKALQYAKANNVISICAAGNEDGPLGYPARYKECVPVRGVTERYLIETWSSRGFSNDNKVHGLSAPMGAWGAYLDNEYDWMMGTSASAPLVAGAAAIAMNHTHSAALAQKALENSALDLGAIGKDPIYGYGFLDLQRLGNHLTNTPPVSSCPHLRRVIARPKNTVSFPACGTLVKRPSSGTLTIDENGIYTYTAAGDRWRPIAQSIVFINADNTERFAVNIETKVPKVRLRIGKTRCITNHNKPCLVRAGHKIRLAAKWLSIRQPNVKASVYLERTADSASQTTTLRKRGNGTFYVDLPKDTFTAGDGIVKVYIRQGKQVSAAFWVKIL